jgi:hypothetical protein
MKPGLSQYLKASPRLTGEGAVVGTLSKRAAPNRLGKHQAWTGLRIGSRYWLHPDTGGRPPDRRVVRQMCGLMRTA